jgi:hypothetical protein
VPVPDVQLGAFDAGLRDDVDARPGCVLGAKTCVLRGRAAAGRSSQTTY